MPIRTFEEFIAACLQHRGVNADRQDDSPYPSREPVAQAVRRWWGEVVSLEVIGPDHYRWTCTGCGSSVECQNEPAHEWDLYDFVLWEHCGTCGPAMHSGTPDAPD